MYLQAKTSYCRNAMGIRKANDFHKRGNFITSN